MYVVINALVQYVFDAAAIETALEQLLGHTYSSSGGPLRGLHSELHSRLSCMQRLCATCRSPVSDSIPHHGSNNYREYILNQAFLEVATALQKDAVALRLSDHIRSGFAPSPT